MNESLNDYQVAGFDELETKLLSGALEVSAAGTGKAACTVIEGPTLSRISYERMIGRGRLPLFPLVDPPPSARD